MRYPNGDSGRGLGGAPSPGNTHSTGSFSKLSKLLDVDELCFTCSCVCTDAHQELASVMEAIDKNIKSIPSDIVFYDDDSFGCFDEEFSFESSSFQDSITFGSSTQHPTVSGQKSGEINALASYYVVTSLPKEQSHLDKKSVQINETKKKKKEKPVIKEIKVNGCANTDGDGGVELVYNGSKAYLKSIGMRQSFIPLHRMKTLRITNQPIDLQGSGDSTKSLSSDEETYEDGTQEGWLNVMMASLSYDEEVKPKQDWKDDMAEKEVKEMMKKEEAETKKEADAKKQSQKQMEKQMMKAQSKAKAEAKRAKKEADAKKQAQIEVEKQMMMKAQSERKAEARKAKKDANAKKQAQKQFKKQMMKAQTKHRNEQKAEARKAKKEADAKKQSEKYAEKQMLKWQSYHRKEQKAEAKRAKKEDRKNKGKANKYEEDKVENSQLFSTLNWRKKINVNELNVHNEISVQEVWRST